MRGSPTAIALLEPTPAAPAGVAEATAAESARSASNASDLQAEHPLSRPLATGFWVNSLSTLGSRFLGMFRDVTTVWLLGISGGGVMDAFVLAWRLPNFVRGLLGEGAFTSGYLPLAAAAQQQGTAALWRLANLSFTALALLLAGIVLSGEAVLGLWAATTGDDGSRLLAQLAAVAWPLVLLASLSGQLGATLQVRGRFISTAAAPALLNLVFLLVAWLFARNLPDRVDRAHLLAAGVLLGGVLHLAWQIFELRRLGWRWRWEPGLGRHTRVLAAAVGPGVLTYLVLGGGAMLDSLLAWGWSAAGRLPLFGAAPPLRAGAASAVYFSERLYQLPIGLIGVALATALFPRFSRHVAAGRWQELSLDVAWGLRLACFLSFPAAAGLLLLAGPLTRLLLGHGQVDADDVARTAALTAVYASAAWASCALPLLLRIWHALGHRRLPLRAAIVAVSLKLLFDVLLVWPLGEIGLAAASVLAWIAQLGILGWRLQYTPAAPNVRLVLRGLLSSAAAAAAMAAAVAAAVAWSESIEGLSGASRLVQGLLLTGYVLTGIVVYVAVARALRMTELRLLLTMSSPSSPSRPACGQS